jgi:hypothetical protein
MEEGFLPRLRYDGFVRVIAQDCIVHRGVVSAATGAYLKHKKKREKM